MTPKEALLQAIAVAGGQKSLADDVKVKPPSITGWLLRGRTPANRVLAVEEATGVSKCLLRPDIYPPPVKPGK